MTNFFAGIYRANDALTAARYGLEVTGQNIANANTPGYTRQRADQVSVGTAVGVPMIHVGPGDNAGVRSTGASRLGDAVLDTRTRAEHARSANVDTHASRLADVENIFREPSDTGLGEQLHDFWNAWGDVSNDPGAQVPREMLLAAAQSTVTMLHAKNAALDDVATAAHHSLDAQITAANTDAKSLADLNKKIAIGHATGANINALLDQRDVLLDNLSKSVGGVATIQANGTASVTVGGSDLVSTGANGVPPFDVGSLVVGPTSWDPSQGATLAINPAGGGPAVTLVDPAAGPPAINLLAESKAAAEIKSLNETVPTYRAKLDDVARALAKTVNNLQTAGFDNNGATGAAMFDDGAGNPAIPGITAANIGVALTGSTAWQQVAAADTQSFSDPPTNSIPTGNKNGGNALAASLKGSDPSGPDTSYSSLVGDLGRASSSAKQQQATQNVITASVDTLKSTASGVSFDEEVSNMLTYQMAFQASSRVLTTLDSMLDTLINRTGLVGRG